MVVALLVGRATGLADELSREAVRRKVAAAGAWGPPLYVGAFTLALLVHMPATGIAFVAVAALVYGRVAGGLLAYAGAFGAVLVSFFLVRAVGGRPLVAIDNRTMRRILARLEARPLMTVVVLRLLFFSGSLLNYALALSGLRGRDYVVGSAIGLLPPVVVLTAFFDLLFR